MSPAALSQLLLLYSWFAVSGLIVFLLLIARFYQRFASVPTHFRLFLVPIVVYGIGAVRYTAVGRIGGDLAGDLMMGTAGISLAALCVQLAHRMLTRKQRTS
jgi:hypothetical protein